MAVTKGFVRITYRVQVFLRMTHAFSPLQSPWISRDERVCKERIDKLICVCFDFKEEKKQVVIRHASSRQQVRFSENPRKSTRTVSDPYCAITKQHEHSQIVTSTCRHQLTSCYLATARPRTAGSANYGRTNLFAVFNMEEGQTYKKNLNFQRAYKPECTSTNRYGDQKSTQSREQIFVDAKEEFPLLVIQSKTSREHSRILRKFSHQHGATRIRCLATLLAKTAGSTNSGDAISPFVRPTYQVTVDCRKHNETRNHSL